MLGITKVRNTNVYNVDVHDSINMYTQTKLEYTMTSERNRHAPAAATNLPHGDTAAYELAMLLALIELSSSPLMSHTLMVVSVYAVMMKRPLSEIPMLMISFSYFVVCKHAINTQ